GMAIRVDHDTDTDTACWAGRLVGFVRDAMPCAFNGRCLSRTSVNALRLLAWQKASPLRAKTRGFFPPARSHFATLPWLCKSSQGLDQPF
ncbi:MAG: hypothetical protein ABW154_08830, partial [Dyella sp.]